MKDDLSMGAAVVLLMSILAVVVIEKLAIDKGINGTGLAASIGVIGAVVGYVGRMLVHRFKK